MKLATAAVMRGLDAKAIHEYGIPGIVLMENAGKGTVAAMTTAFGSLVGQVVAIVVGPGNNGGDGLVIARHLHQLGCRPHLLYMVDPEKLQGDAAMNQQVVKKLPIPFMIVKSDADLQQAGQLLRQAAVIVDAIFGTGLAREAAGLFEKIIGLMNSSGRPVVAVDIPSGLDSDSGQPLGTAVSAKLTVTYGLAKPGHVIYPGALLSGTLEVVDIGIPPEAVAQAGITLELLQRQDAMQLLPKRPLNSHKGVYGHVLVLAGSQGKTGAAILAAQGALRSGAGLVTLAVPKKLNPIFEVSLAEAMTVPLGSDHCMTIDDYPAIAAALNGKNSVVLGPGIGVEEETASLVLKLYEEVALPMVVDADALNVLARDGRKCGSGSGRVLTPHPGEMARLMKLSTAEIQQNRLQVALQCAQERQAVVVLKGAATIIAAPDGRAAVNPTGNPGMAAGGMGDVLAGVIGSFLAQGLDPWQAACLGVYVHGMAGDRIAKNHNILSGYLASELASELPLAFHEILA